MKGLLSCFGLGFIKFTGLFPFWMLHVKSNVCAFLIGNVFRYRRNVMEENLSRVGIEGVSMRGIYLNLTDLAFESAKLFTVNPLSLNSRLEYENLDIIEGLFKKGKHIVLAGGHMANWEMFSLSLPSMLQHKTIAIYKKLNNPVFEKAIIKSRSRTGMKIIEMNEMASWLETGINDGPVLCSMIFDQSPRNPNKALWTHFLGVETPVYSGIEKIAQRMDAAVVYAAIKRTARGRYTIAFTLLEEDVFSIERGVVIEKCYSELEKEIINCPESWLWSHRRWKHKRPSNVKLHKRKITKFGG